MKDKSINPVKSSSNHSHPLLKQLLVILIITIIAQLSNLAYTNFADGQNFVDIVFPSLLFLFLTTIPAAGLGLWLGRDIGLGTRLLSDLMSKKSDTIKILRQDARLASILGLMIGTMLFALRFFIEDYLPPELPNLGHRGVIGGLLVSIGAAIGEEVWFRLGLMTVLVWLATRIFGHNEVRSSVAWTIIIVVSLGFGLAHLPQLMSYGAGSPFAIWGTILGNSTVGILYGWCYWRKSLFAAIIAHFSVDLVLHVLPAVV